MTQVEKVFKELTLRKAKELFTIYNLDLHKIDYTYGKCRAVVYQDKHTLFYISDTNIISVLVGSLEKIKNIKTNQSERNIMIEQYNNIGVQYDTR